MFRAITRRLFGSANDRILKSFKKYVEATNLLETQIAVLSDTELANQTVKLKEKLANGASLDDILPESFATIREVAKRTLGQRHFDVQLLGGVALHKGMIPEMRTGEGKTLVSTLPTYLNALTGKGVHIITVNDYLASRDAEWMGQIYRFLGLTIGCITHDLSDVQRQMAYNADITYGTNNEFGFDYLRDNMKFSCDQMVQRKFNYAIIDEVDSILIDEARTPLIISGPTEDNSELYTTINKLMPKLSTTDYDKDEKAKTVILTEEGTNHVEDMLKAKKLIDDDSSLYDIENIALVHHINQALKAHFLFTIDVDYMLQDRKVMIIDEFTGRMMEGRRYSEGLHQALEAKENVPIQNENQTLASITFQNYFRLYPKLSGMTGTCMTEASELMDIYNLEVVEIPTNIPVMRIDEDDDIFGTAKEKYDAIINVIEENHKRQQPILVGTISIEKSEYISNLLKKRNIPHHVLNARYHEQEAHIIANAGMLGAVTIATNMAGRGTDIKLGGNSELMIEEIRKSIAHEGDETFSKAKAEIIAKIEYDKQKIYDLGGLLILATERHESRRIDNQLRGRSGRQGDPGKTKFFLSFEDDLIRIFASDRVASFLQKYGLSDGEPITHPMISRTIEKAQMKVEAHNYEIRKNLLKFDDVMNDQRKIIYQQRIEIMQSDDLQSTIVDMYQDLNYDLITQYLPKKSYIEQWDLDTLSKEIWHIYGLHLDFNQWIKADNIGADSIAERLTSEIEHLFQSKDETYGHGIMNMAKQRCLLMTLDQLWKDHLLSLDHLRQGISLRAYAQKDPLNEYKREAFHMFANMINHLSKIFIERISHLTIAPSHMTEEFLSEKHIPKPKLQETRTDPAFLSTEIDQSLWGKIGRNDLCPCGSEKKYKHCHGSI